MMIVDYSQVCIANLFAQFGNSKNIEIELDLFRHMVLNSIGSYNRKFRNEYGPMVIACDGKSSWRKEVFPYYKANRKKYRDDSIFDWNKIYEYMDQIRSELNEIFPYTVIKIDNCEADDIIAVLSKKFYDVSNILIISCDKDFVQLQRYPNIKQYDPIRSTFISSNDPENFLFEHILKGDSGDGVPNILSPGDVFVSGGRQKPLTQKKMDHFKNEGIPEDLKRGFDRNKTLIDLDSIPVEISNNISEYYKNYPVKNKSNLFNFFVEKKLKNLLERIGDF